MSLELCWTEQLGLNHFLGSQGTFTGDIYRIGEKVKCYQYLGVFAQNNIFFFFSLHILLLYVGLI